MHLQRTGESTNADPAARSHAYSRQARGSTAYYLERRRSCRRFPTSSHCSKTVYSSPPVSKSRKDQSFIRFNERLAGRGDPASSRRPHSSTFERLLESARYLRFAVAQLGIQPGRSTARTADLISLFSTGNPFGSTAAYTAVRLRFPIAEATDRPAPSASQLRRAAPSGLAPTPIPRITSIQKARETPTLPLYPTPRHRAPQQYPTLARGPVPWSRHTYDAISRKPTFRVTEQR